MEVRGRPIWKTLWGSPEQEGEELNRAAKEEDGLLWAPGADQPLGDTTCGEAEVQEGETGEQKVHGRVDAGVEHRQELRNQDNQP